MHAYSHSVDEGKQSRQEQYSFVHMHSKCFNPNLPV